MQPSEFERIRKEELQLTQTELGKELGVGRWVISRIEKGLTVPPTYDLAIRQLLWQKRILPLL